MGGPGMGRGGKRIALTASELPAGYVCKRCHLPGHHIRDCPTNSNSAYDPFDGKGVPKNELWKRDTGIAKQQFLESKPRIFRKIVKEAYVYECGELEHRLKEKKDILNQQ